jgi:hypothetical protein
LKVRTPPARAPVDRLGAGPGDDHQEPEREQPDQNRGADDPEDLRRRGDPLVPALLGRCEPFRLLGE